MSAIRYSLILFLVPLQLMASHTFSQNCRAIGDDYLKFSIETDNVDIQSGSSFTLKITAFEDEKCQSEYLQYNQYFTVDKIHTDKINLKTIKVTYTSLTDEVSRALRLIKYCDFADWKTKTEINVTGQMCDDFQQLAKDDIFYQIIKSTPSQLQFGQLTDALDGRSSEKRPTDFDSLDYQSN